MKLLEYWKPIPGFDRYQASYSGKIRHLGKVVKRGRYVFDWVSERILSPSLVANGYYVITISEYGRSFTDHVHILVANAFIPNPDKLPEINHKNSVRHDNQVANLERCTHKQNMEHAAKNGRMKGSRKKDKRHLKNYE